MYGVIFVGLQLLRIMRRRATRKTLINTAFFVVLLFAIGGMNKNANKIQDVFQRLLGNCEHKPNNQITKSMSNCIEHYTSSVEESCYCGAGTRVKMRGICNPLGEFPYCYKGEPRAKPQCTGTGRIASQRNTGCLCPSMLNFSECPVSKNNIYCFFEKCFNLPQCTKSEDYPVKDSKCICRNIDTYENICEIGSYCSYGMDKCYQLEKDTVLLTGTEVYEKEQKGKEVPGDRIKDYATHRDKRTNGYYYVDKDYDQEELQNDDYVNKHYLFDERKDYRLFKSKDEVHNLHHFQTPQLHLHTSINLYNWVLSPSNELYIFNKQGVHHNDFLNSGPVLAAGQLRINKDGKVTWNNKSGHYKPGFESLKHILKYFEKQGMAGKDMQYWLCHDDNPWKQFELKSKKTEPIFCNNIE